MAVDPTPAYGPSRAITSAQISDFTAAGRAMGTAVDAAAQRALLSIADVGDLRNYAVSRAITLLGLTNPDVAIDESFEAKPTQVPNYFTANGGVAVTQRTDRNGGWTTMATGAGASSTSEIHHGNLPPVVANAGTQKWYQLWVASVDTAIDSASDISMGWFNTAFTAYQPCVGVLGSGSTAKFRAFDHTTGVNSTVNIDTGIHIFEHVGLGTGNVGISVDGETLVTYATAKTAILTPYADANNGATAAVRSLSVGHLIVITPQS